MSIEAIENHVLVTFEHEDHHSKFTKKAKQYIRELNCYCVNKRLSQYRIPEPTQSILDKLYHHQKLINQSVLNRRQEREARERTERACERTHVIAYPNKN